jgi:LemA protein
VGTGILIAAAVILFLAVIFIYNDLIAKRNMASNAFSSIDVMLKKRYNLIPNLVAAVKGYMEHEKTVLSEITELRSQAISMQISDKQKIELDNKISGILDRIFMVAEQYPDLKASESFLKLQAALNDIEEQIQAARRAYNAAVTDLNNAVQMFPSNMVASLLGFKRMMLFTIDSSEKQSRQWFNS